MAEKTIYSLILGISSLNDSPLYPADILKYHLSRIFKKDFDICYKSDSYIEVVEVVSLYPKDSPTSKQKQIFNRLMKDVKTGHYGIWSRWISVSDQTKDFSCVIKDGEYDFEGR